MYVTRSGIAGPASNLLVFYLVLTAAACFLVAGILPMMVLLAGLWLAKRKCDLSPLREAGRLIAWFYGVLAIVSFLAALSHGAALSHAGLASLSVIEHQYYARFFGFVTVLAVMGWSLTRHAVLPALRPSRRCGSVTKTAAVERALPPGAARADRAKWGQIRAQA